MNNERYNQIIDEAYENYYEYMRDDRQWELDKEEFINKCKTDLDFSQKWGLKIEERELSVVERMEYYGKHFMNLTESKTFDELLKVNYDELNIPNKLIRITYNKKTIETYE